MATRSRLSFWIFIIVVVIVHLALRVALGLNAAAPDLMTVAVLLSARVLRGASAAAVGLGLGILADALSPTTFGAQALVNTIIGYLGARSRDLFEGDSLLFAAAYVFLGKWLRDAIYILITQQAHVEPWAMLITNAPLAALYAAFGAILALMLYRAATGER
jgi:rod shape-determining protein MreD